VAVGETVVFENIHLRGFDRPIGVYNVLKEAADEVVVVVVGEIQVVVDIQKVGRAVDNFVYHRLSLFHLHRRRRDCCCCCTSTKNLLLGFLGFFWWAKKKEKEYGKLFQQASSLGSLRCVVHSEFCPRTFFGQYDAFGTSASRRN
jgi:hypothetical protein